MPHIKIWVHAVWSTKNRLPILIPEIRPAVISHNIQNAKNKGIHINIINGEIEHLHALISLADFNISSVMKFIKGESTFWINKHKLIRQRFEWQEEYFAVSISESQKQRIRDYILNQKEHQKKKSFAEEYKEFISKYKFIKEG